MSDVTEAPTQAEIADSLVADEQQPVEQPEALQEVDEQQPIEQEQEQPQETEDWLPTDQDKTFPDDVLLRYAERYGINEQGLTNPQIRQLVVDKINTDIYVQQMQQQNQIEYEEPEPVQEPTPNQTQLTREQYYQNLDRAIAERTDPQNAMDFTKGFVENFLPMFGVPQQEVARYSAAIAPQQAQAFTGWASRHMLNLANTFFGDMLGPRFKEALFQAIPGFDEGAITRWSHGQAWEKVRNSSPQFGKLPHYGTPEFSQTMRAAAERMPEIAEMIDNLQGYDAKQVPKFYGILARIASGQNVDPATLQKAAQSVARSQRRAEIRRTNGNLGSGQSTRGSAGTGSSQFQSNTDIFDDETMGLWQREHGRL